MGMVKISLLGSFCDRPYGEMFQVHKAQEHGHAEALAAAIKWLAEKMPEAIRHDHDLHAHGYFPEDRYGLPQPDSQ